MSKRQAPRVVLVIDHPAQHFAEAFRHTARSNRIDVSILYWSDNQEGQFDHGFGREVSWDVDLLSGYPWRRTDGGTRWRRVTSFVRSLRELGPDVVLAFGWASAAARLAIVWCAVTRTPLLLYGDTTWQHSAHRTRRRVRGLLLGVLVRIAAGALATGTFNRDFYIYTGMHPQQVFDGVCPVDVASYATARAERPIGSAPHAVIGFAGKLIARKGVDELLHTLAALADDDRWRARIVGDGPERPRLEALVRSLGISDRVDMMGFRNTAAMPAELAACDILVVPSRRDMRVLVAAEAMAAGAALVVSSKTAIWGRGDLVEDGVTGRVYRSGDPGDLASVLSELLDDPPTRARLQSEGARRAQGQGPEDFTKGLEEAVAAVCT